MKSERIAKRIAASGLCSRRDAESWIAAGRVRVNGEVISSPALNVTNEPITVDGNPLPEVQAARLFRYYKPVGLVTTHKDEQGRATVFGTLPADMPRVVSVGRLDVNSEGLLLLTTSGEMARAFELPASAHERVYRVRVHGAVDTAALRALKNGIEIEGVHYGAIRVDIERRGASNAWLQVSLQEGKNREIRRVMNHLGLQVNRLIRVQYGPYALGALKPGEVEEVVGAKKTYKR